MNAVKEFRNPLIIAGGALIVSLLLWVVLVSPQNSKLASLQAQSVTLVGQETALQAKLSSLRSESQKLSGNCVDLQKISAQIPSVQTPTDINAEESSFESQFNDLAATSGVTLAQFSGFAPAGTSATSAQPTTGGSSTTPSGVTAVPTTLTVQGDFGQMTSFINGLDSFPRLFIIQKLTLAFGAASSGSSGASGSTSSSGAAPASSAGASGPPLWVGGQATSPTNGPYNLQVTGSIYYTSTPDALAACSKATAALQKKATA
jgi:Tfp pilus assembly protein PilO